MSTPPDPANFSKAVATAAAAANATPAAGPHPPGHPGRRAIITTTST